MAERTSPCSGVSHCAMGACALKETDALVRTLHFPRGTGGGVQVQAPGKTSALALQHPAPYSPFPGPHPLPPPRSLVLTFRAEPVCLTHKHTPVAISRSELHPLPACLPCFHEDTPLVPTTPWVGLPQGTTPAPLTPLTPYPVISKSCP